MPSTIGRVKSRYGLPDQHLSGQDLDLSFRENVVDSETERPENWPSSYCSSFQLSRGYTVHFPLLTSPAKRLEAFRGMTRHERVVSEERDLRFYTNLGLLIAVGIGALVAGFHTGAFTAALAAYGAAVGLGGILGFLFGVPSAAKAPITINKADSMAVGTGPGSSAVGGNVGTTTVAPPPSGSNSESLPDNGIREAANDIDSASQTVSSVAPLITAEAASTNHLPDPIPPAPASTSSPISNLEQVADWVTKLLLGGGLTQMQRIPPKVWQWSRIVALGILRDQPQASEQLIVAQQAFAAGLLVYGFIVGFFGGFLITKLQLGKAISDSM
jgi:hypothetical protein